jgi:hypothetical protein
LLCGGRQLCGGRGGARWLLYPCPRECAYAALLVSRPQDAGLQAQVDDIRARCGLPPSPTRAASTGGAAASADGAAAEPAPAAEPSVPETVPAAGAGGPADGPAPPPARDPPVTDADTLRFLRARKGDAAAASEMLAKALAWRARVGMGQVRCEACAVCGNPVYSRPVCALAPLCGTRPVASVCTECSVRRSTALSSLGRVSVHGVCCGATAGNGAVPRLSVVPRRCATEPGPVAANLLRLLPHDQWACGVGRGRLVRRVRERRGGLGHLVFFFS